VYRGPRELNRFLSSRVSEQRMVTGNPPPGLCSDGYPRGQASNNRFLSRAAQLRVGGPRNNARGSLSRGVSGLPFQRRSSPCPYTLAELCRVSRASTPEILRGWRVYVAVSAPGPCVRLQRLQWLINPLDLPGEYKHPSRVRGAKPQGEQHCICACAPVCESPVSRRLGLYPAMARRCCERIAADRQRFDSLPAIGKGPDA
jgi:hypothetical protein